MASFHQNEASPVEMASDNVDHAGQGSAEKPAAGTVAAAELPSPETPTAPEDPSIKDFNDVIQSEVGHLIMPRSTKLIRMLNY